LEARDTYFLRFQLASNLDVSSSSNMFYIEEAPVPNAFVSDKAFEGADAFSIVFVIIAGAIVIVVLFLKCVAQGLGKVDWIWTFAIAVQCLDLILVLMGWRLMLPMTKTCHDYMIGAVTVQAFQLALTFSSLFCKGKFPDKLLIFLDTVEGGLIGKANIKCEPENDSSFILFAGLLLAMGFEWFSVSAVNDALNYNSGAGNGNGGGANSSGIQFTNVSTTKV
jgi:hypothetical protein